MTDTASVNDPPITWAVAKAGLAGARTDEYAKYVPTPSVA